MLLCFLTLYREAVSHIAFSISFRHIVRSFQCWACYNLQALSQETDPVVLKLDSLPSCAIFPTCDRPVFNSEFGSGSTRIPHEKGQMQWSHYLHSCRICSSLHTFLFAFLAAVITCPLHLPTITHHYPSSLSSLVHVSSVLLSLYLNVLSVLPNCRTFHCVILNSIVLAHFPSVSKSSCSLVHSWNLSTASFLSWCHLCLDTQQPDPTSGSFM